MIQTQVLNYILSTGDSSIITLNNLSDVYFSDYKGEFNFIKNHYDSYNKIPDKATFLESFPDFNIVDVNEPSNYLIDELFKDYKKRQMVKSFNKVKNSLMNDDIDEAMSVYANSFDTITNIGTPFKCIDITKDTSRYNAYVERVNDFSKYYIKTGFDALDDIIGGIDRKEELFGIVARPNVGKSWILLDMAIAGVKQGLNVGYYSGEMSERKVGYRFDTLYGHMNNGGITHGNESFMNDYKRYIDELPNSVKGSLKVITPEMIGGYATVNNLRAFIEREHLDMLCVDQLSLMEDQRRGKALWEQQSNIIKDLKNLQVMTYTPILFACQQTRGDMLDGRNTEMVAGSDDISRFATILVFLTRKNDTLTMELTKSRDSENFKKLNYVIELNTGKFQYVPSEEDSVDGDSSEDLDSRYDSIDSNGDEVF